MKNRKKMSIISIITAAALATAFMIFHKPIPKPEPIEGPRICLNDTLKNTMSEIPELEGLDRKVTRYMRDWQMKGASLVIMRNDSWYTPKATDGPMKKKA